MQPYPGSPDLVWPGHLHGTGCLSARAMDTGFPTVSWRLCLGLSCGWARDSAAPRHSWLGSWGVCALVCALRLYPATPGWAMRFGFVCFGPGFGCAPPLLAGVSGFVSACVRAPLAPRRSWLGCAVCVCVLRLGFRLHPATPRWGFGLYVCLCACSACTPPLLAGLCGVGVCAWVQVSDAPRHSWLGCAVWVCVLRLGFRLRPATPGWGVGLCVFLCACSACTPPLLAGVCGVGVCAWARALAAPRHSWLGCWGVFVFVGARCLYPATPGWRVRCGRGCLGCFGCAPPLLAGVLGCVCVCVRAPLVPRHFLLGCAVWVCLLRLGFRLCPATPGCGVGCVCVCGRAPRVPRHSWLGCAVWVCVLGLGFRLRPATPGWGVGCVCVCGRPPRVPRHCWLGFVVWVCVLGVRFRLRPCHSGLRCWGVFVFVGALCLYPATAGWGVRCGCVCLGSGFGCAPPLLAGCRGLCLLVCALRLHPAAPGWDVSCACVCFGSGLGCAPPLLAGLLGCLCACVRALLVPRHSWLGCGAWVCVLGLGSRLRPTTPGCGVGVCVCLCTSSACTPPLLAGVCGVGVCAAARVSAAPRHSWLGCWAMCVLVCVLCLYPATPGWGVRRECVCLGSCFGCAPSLLAGVFGCVCVCGHAPLVPRHSSLGCALWALVPGLFRLRPVTSGWGVGVCVCLCGRFACTPPLVVAVCGVGVCAWALVSAAPCHSWLGYWVCVCLWGCPACTPPLLAGMCGVGVCAWARVAAAPRHCWLGCWGVCVFLCALHVYPTTPGSGLRCGCVCLGSGFGCALPLLTWALVCVCVCGLAPLVPCHSWLGCSGVCVGLHLLLVPRYSWLRCALCVCVLGLGFRLRPATSGRGVGVCVSVCSVCLYPTFPGWGLWFVGWMLPGTCSCAVVCCGSCALPGFAAPGGCCCLAPVPVPWLWPAACLSGVPRGPALVHRGSSGLVALGAPVGFPDAVVPFPIPGAYASGITGRLPGARKGRPRTGLVVPAAGRCRGSGAGLAPRRTRSGPRDEVFPGGSLWRWSWAACAAVVWCVGTRSLTRPVSRTARLLTGDSAGAPALFCVDADTVSFGLEDATPRSRACVRVRALLGRVGQAGLPGAFWCASPFLWPVLVRSLFVRPPPGWGCPVCGCCWVFFSFSLPLPCRAPVVSFFACFPARGALGLGVLLSPFPPPFFSSFLFFFPLLFPCPLFFFPPPLSLAFRVFRPGLLGALAPCYPPPPFCFLFPSPLPVVFFSCFSVVSWFFFLAGCALWGRFPCCGLSGVPMCGSVVLSLSLLFVRCSLASLALAGVVWCCLLCLGVCY